MHEYWLSGFGLWLSAQRRTPQTIAQYRHCARRFLAYLGDREITRRVVTEHMASFDKLSRAYQAINYHGVRAFLDYLRAEEELDVPQMPGSAPRVWLVWVDVPSEKDVQALIKASRSGRYPLRNEAIVRVLASTGMRRSECAGILVADIDLGPMPRVKVMGKGEKPRYVPLSAKTALILRRYLRHRQEHRYAMSPRLWLGDQGPVGASAINELVERAARRAGVSIHPHQLRHAFCHEFQAGGGQVNELAHIVGWSSPAMAMRYARATLGDRAEERARALAIGDRF